MDEKQIKDLVKVQVNPLQVLGTFLITLLVTALLVRIGWNLSVVERFPELIMTYRQAIGVSILLGIFGSITGGGRL